VNRQHARSPPPRIPAALLTFQAAHLPQMQQDYHLLPQTQQRSCLRLLQLATTPSRACPVYQGVSNGKPVYVGITNNTDVRAAQHGDRFVLEELVSGLTRGEARAVEQAIIAQNPGYQNLINSISPSHPWYQQAVDWGEVFLRANGLG
jgi:hypothetical protein